MARDMFHLLESMPTAATLISARHRLEAPVVREATMKVLLTGVKCLSEYLVSWLGQPPDFSAVVVSSHSLLPSRYSRLRYWSPRWL